MATYTHSHDIQPTSEQMEIHSQFTAELWKMILKFVSIISDADAKIKSERVWFEKSGPKAKVTARETNGGIYFTQQWQVTITSRWVLKHGSSWVHNVPALCLCTCVCWWSCKKTYTPIIRQWDISQFKKLKPVIRERTLVTWGNSSKIRIDFYISWRKFDWFVLVKLTAIMLEGLCWAWKMLCSWVVVNMLLGLPFMTVGRCWKCECCFNFKIKCSQILLAHTIEKLSSPWIILLPVF